MAVASIIKRITCDRYHYPVGRVTQEKIAYFATKAGLPTGLTFEKRFDGPFAERSKGMFTALIDNGLIEERRSGRMFITTPGPALCDAEERFARELSRWEPTVERVADLFLRLPSARVAESFAAVHCIAEPLSGLEPTRGEANTAPDILKRVKEWIPHLRDEEISGAIQTLAYLGWIDHRLLMEAAELSPVSPY